MLNLYVVLDVDPSATSAEIKVAYHRRARETHPDHGGNAERFAQVRQAYATLSNDDKREAWEQAYRRAAAASKATVCEGCFTAQARGTDPACVACGERWPEQKSQAAKSMPLPPRIERLKNDVIDRLGDAAIDVGARIGDEIAAATISTVNQTIDRLAQRLGRTARRRS